MFLTDVGFILENMRRNARRNARANGFLEDSYVQCMFIIGEESKSCEIANVMHAHLTSPEVFA